MLVKIKSISIYICHDVTFSLHKLKVLTVIEMLSVQ